MKVSVLLGTVDSSLIYADAVVAIDVLRSSTTILTALANGAENIIPAATMDEALTIGGKLNAILGGEVNSVKPHLFQIGNSPLEYVREKVDGKTIVLYTSSGTRLLRFLTAISKKVLVGALVNITSLVEYLKKEKFNRVSIIIAGKTGSPALEDTYCAGLIAMNLPWEECNRDAEIAMKTAEVSVDIVKEARHASELIKLGLGRDVEYSLTLDKIKIVAEANYSKGCIRLPSQLSS
ncbi:MAG: 2-phosphosulfolactate phosphatase [Thermoproteota archaeon]